MRLSAILVTVFLAATMSGAAGSALAGPECLVGTWVGTLDGWKGKEGNARKMVVQSIAADGTATVLWGLPEQAKPSAATNVQVKGESITFVTGPGGKVEATCKGDRVSGAWTWTSRPYFFDFKKQPG